MESKPLQPLQPLTASAASGAPHGAIFFTLWSSIKYRYTIIPCTCTISSSHLTSAESSYYKTLAYIVTAARFTEAFLSLGKHLATPPVVPTLPSGPHPDVQQPPQLLLRQLQGLHSALSQHIHVLVLLHIAPKLPPGPHPATPMGTPSCSPWNTPRDNQPSPQHMPRQSRGSVNVLLHPKNKIFLRIFFTKISPKFKILNSQIYSQKWNPTLTSRDIDDFQDHQEKLTKIRILELSLYNVCILAFFGRKFFPTKFTEISFILVYQQSTGAFYTCRTQVILACKLQVGKKFIESTPMTNPAPLNGARYTYRTQVVRACKLQAKLFFIEPTSLTNPAPIIRAGKFKPHGMQSKSLKFTVNSGHPFEGLRHTLEPNSSSKNDR
jgi:hypothetical protein